MNFELYSKSMLIINEAEAYLIGEKKASLALVNKIKTHAYFPYRFLALGISERLRGPKKWAWITFAVAIVGVILFDGLGAEFNSIKSSIFTLVPYVTLLAVTFAMPSTYGNCGVSQADISSIREIFLNAEILKKREIEGFAKILAVIEMRCKKRLLILKWITGLIWSGFTYILVRYVESKSVDFVATQRDLVELIGIFSFTSFGWFLVWSYDGAIEKLFRTLEFACIELKNNDELDFADEE